MAEREQYTACSVVCIVPDRRAGVNASRKIVVIARSLDALGDGAGGDDDDDGDGDGREIIRIFQILPAALAV